jgi:hypothetical protein
MHFCREELDCRAPPASDSFVTTKPIDISTQLAVSNRPIKIFDCLPSAYTDSERNLPFGFVHICSSDNDIEIPNCLNPNSLAPIQIRSRSHP